jgi:SAM-dependent methyltransferase
MKDLFSPISQNYATFRPSFPEEVYKYISAYCFDKEYAWDCATGNGQASKILVNYFKKIFASDISDAQISQAFQHPKIQYKSESAEASSAPDNSFDFIVVAQGVHWFDIKKFYQEVNRTIKDHGVLALLGYGLLRTTDELDIHIGKLYTEKLKGYWEPERKYIDNHYRNIPFPFVEVPVPEFFIKVQWKRDELIGYLNTWSAMQLYIKKNNQNPLMELFNELDKIWVDGTSKEFKFPVFCRLGRIN